MSSLINKLLISDRCYLSNVLESDKDTIVKHLQEKSISDGTLTMPFPYTEDDALAFINEYKNSKQQFMIRSSNDMLIGNIGVREHPTASHIGVLGYWLAKPLWSKGIMTEVVSKFTDFCFKDFKFERIVASCYEHNIGSARVLEKSGFTLEGLFIKHYKKNGTFYNGKMYGKVI